MTALIEAAAELFSQHGVKAVSVRNIAEKAGVNHGLVHRHFGSKEMLRLKTQEYLAADIRDEIGGTDNFTEAITNALAALKKKDIYWRVMAYTLLENKDERNIQEEFPFIKRMVELAFKEQKKKSLPKGIAPGHIVAGITALGLGMQVFERYILPATGLETDSAEDVLKILFLWMHEMFMNS